MSEWYFAYGSNLWIDQMIERTGLLFQGENRPRLARLSGYQVVFNMRGESGKVFANIEASNTVTLGVIYRCTPDAFKELDDFEEGYERLRVSVVIDNGETCEAIAYVAKPENIAIGRKPSAEYLRKIVTGARQHGLPEAYIREIEAKAV